MPQSSYEAYVAKKDAELEENPKAYPAIDEGAWESIVYRDPKRRPKEYQDKVDARAKEWKAQQGKSPEEIEREGKRDQLFREELKKRIGEWDEMSSEERSQAIQDAVEERDRLEVQALGPITRLMTPEEEAQSKAEKAFSSSDPKKGVGDHLKSVGSKLLGLAKKGGGKLLEGAKFTKESLKDLSTNVKKIRDGEKLTKREKIQVAAGIGAIVTVAVAALGVGWALTEGASIGDLAQQSADDIAGESQHKIDIRNMSASKLLGGANAGFGSGQLGPPQFHETDLGGGLKSLYPGRGLDPSSAIEEFNTKVKMQEAVGTYAEKGLAKLHELGVKGPAAQAADQVSKGVGAVAKGVGGVAEGVGKALTTKHFASEDSKDSEKYSPEVILLVSSVLKVLGKHFSNMKDKDLDKIVSRGQKAILVDILEKSKKKKKGQKKASSQKIASIWLGKKFGKDYLRGY